MLDTQPYIERKQRLLLEEGLTRLLQYGYHGMGMADLLQAVGMPKGSFYHRYASKEAFVADVIQYYGYVSAKRWDNFIHHANTDSFTTLTQGYQKIVEDFKEDAHQVLSLYNALSSDVLTHSKLCCSALQEVIRELQARLTKLIQQAQLQKHMRDDIAAEDLAALYWDAWQGSLIRAKIEASPAPLARYVDTIVYLSKR